jgi:hypothetical protein
MGMEDIKQLGILHLQLNPGHQLYYAEFEDSGVGIVVCILRHNVEYEMQANFQMITISPQEPCTFHVHVLPEEEELWREFSQMHPQ